ncbi:hypothetical protein DFP86_102280 [Paludibacterium purpuratum]|uniref:Uncharacterized protein n=1 Tax=Paludibacterium purpuratum TaxID=1144873 RepID=A0A4R7BEH6_9NEIS|nr:hypothetical protein DFP86_102280 [Paludibacterium purpuratum]
MCYLTELYGFLRLQAIGRTTLDELHGAGRKLIEDEL